MSVKTIGPLLREENYLIFLYFFLGRAQRGAVSHSVLGTSIKFDIALPVWNRRDDHLFLFFLSLPTNETCTVEIVFKYATNIISKIQFKVNNSFRVQMLHPPESFLCLNKEGVLKMSSLRYISESSYLEQSKCKFSQSQDLSISNYNKIVIKKNLKDQNITLVYFHLFSSNQKYSKIL